MSIVHDLLRPQNSPLKFREVKQLLEDLIYIEDGTYLDPWASAPAMWQMCCWWWKKPDKFSVTRNTHMSSNSCSVFREHSFENVGMKNIKLQSHPEVGWRHCGRLGGRGVTLRLLIRDRVGRRGDIGRKGDLGEEEDPGRQVGCSWVPCLTISV